MLSISPPPPSQPPFSSSPKSKARVFLNCIVCRDARFPAKLNGPEEQLARLRKQRSDLATIRRGDELASGTSMSDPVVGGLRRLPWQRPSPPRVEANGEKNPMENKKEQAISKEMKIRKIGGSELDFVRYQTSSDGADLAGELQASIVSYKKKLPWRLFDSGFQVDLVSCVHIADKMYFDALQEKLKSYDCVLFEGVTDSDEFGDKPKMKVFSIVGLIQRLMGRILSLDFQLDCINYKTPNWYNADLDLDSFTRLQDERGEGIFSFVGGAMNSALKSDSTTAQFESFRSKFLRVSWLVPMPLLFSFIINSTFSETNKDEKDNEETDYFGDIINEFLELGFGPALKANLARSLTSEFASEINDALKDSVIIGERNKAALEALKWAISRGEKKIAIFYGAGHMPDLGNKLEQEFNLVPSEINWLTAWTIKRYKSQYLAPFIEKYLPFDKSDGALLVAKLFFSGVLLLDLWLWWSFVNWAGFNLVKLVQAFLIV